MLHEVFDVWTLGVAFLSVDIRIVIRIVWFSIDRRRLLD
jgi:hypothetical protein